MLLNDNSEAANNKMYTVPQKSQTSYIFKHLRSPINVAKRQQFLAQRIVV